jgi:sugar phosphate isomerase/epimerase
MSMNRRVFLAQLSAAVGVAPVLSSTRLSALQGAAGPSIPPAVLQRIGITTVCFRNRFLQTAPKDAAAKADLTLLAAPKFIADSLGIHNVEVWNAHFENESPEYCAQVKDAAAKVGSRFTNIQLDASYDLSAADAAKRAESITFVKGWMDRAKAIGAPTLRANTGPAKAGTPFEPATIADSFKQLAAYGKTIGVKILIENHIGFSADVDKVVTILKAVDDPNCGAITDWGNSKATNIDQRVADMKKLMPYLALVSAKELDFDANNNHTSYDVVPLIKATEASGFRGIYSIEFYTDKNPPPDPVVAAKKMMTTIAANIKA